MKYIIVSLTAIVMMVSMAHAQEVIAQPLRQILHLSPGEHLEGDIELTNREAVTNTVEITFEDLNADDYPTPWIQLPTNTLTLTPHGTTSIHYRIDVPEDAYGELCARFGYSVIPSKKTGMLPIQTEINAPIYVIIEGRADYTAEFSTLEVISHDPLFVRGSVIHHGTAHVRSNPHATISTSPDGKFVAAFDLNDAPRVFYPHGTPIIF